MRELRFDWQAGPEGTSLDVRVEASDDLRAWHVAGSGPLIVLRHGDALLERRAIELSPMKRKYDRISWRPGQDALKLTGVSALPVDAVAGRGAPGRYTSREPYLRRMAWRVKPGR